MILRIYYSLINSFFDPSILLWSISSLINSFFDPSILLWSISSLIDFFFDSSFLLWSFYPSLILLSFFDQFLLDRFLLWFFFPSLILLSFFDPSILLWSIPSLIDFFFAPSFLLWSIPSLINSHFDNQSLLDDYYCINIYMYRSISITELDYKSVFKCIIMDIIIINWSEFDFLQIFTDDINVC